MSSSSKYVVIHDRRAITRRTQRKQAFAVAALLGPEYWVYNTYTREAASADTIG